MTEMTVVGQRLHTLSHIRSLIEMQEGGGRGAFFHQSPVIEQHRRQRGHRVKDDVQGRVQILRQISDQIIKLTTSDAQTWRYFLTGTGGRNRSSPSIPTPQKKQKRKVRLLKFSGIVSLHSACRYASLIRIKNQTEAVEIRYRGVATISINYLFTVLFLVVRACDERREAGRAGGDE